MRAGEDTELALIHHMLKKGHRLEYVLGLDMYSKRLYLASMIAELEDDRERGLRLI